MRNTVADRVAPLMAALVVAVVAGPFVSLPRAEIIEQVLVKVNGEIFTKTELENRQVLALRQRGQQFDPKNDPNNVALRKALDEVTPQILVDTVDEMLIVQRGKELGYRLGDEQFKSVVDGIRKENHLDTDEQFQSALKQEGMTMTELRKNIERNMIMARVQQNEVFGKVAVTDAEARKYYDAHMNEFTTTPTISLREILVAVPGSGQSVNVGLDEAAHQKADAIRSRALSGESFEKLAADMSDAPSRANAGLIGPLSMKDLSPELRALIEPMKVGDVSVVFRTPRGYQVLKLESSTPSQIMPFDQAREQISDHVITDKRKVEFQKYLEKIRAEAIIEWKNADLKRAYDEGVAAQQAKKVQASSS